MRLGLLFLFSCGWEQNVVENQSVARRILVQRQVCRRIVDSVLIVFGIVTAIPRERAAADVACNVLHLVGSFALREDRNPLLHESLVKRGRLTEESADDTDVI